MLVYLSITNTNKEVRSYTVLGREFSREIEKNFMECHWKQALEDRISINIVRGWNHRNKGNKEFCSMRRA